MKFIEITFPLQRLELRLARVIQADRWCFWATDNDKSESLHSVHPSDVKRELMWHLVMWLNTFRTLTRLAIVFLQGPNKANKRIYSYYDLFVQTLKY